MKITKQRLREIIGEELAEVRAPFPAGSRVKHEDYGDGRVTHAGTKNTNVAVLFDKEGPDGKKSRQVSRGSLKRAQDEGLRASRIRQRSAEDVLADVLAALVELENVMKFLLNQKMTAEPGSPEHTAAQERLQRLAAVAQEYADVGRLREDQK